MKAWRGLVILCIAFVVSATSAQETELSGTIAFTNWTMAYQAQHYLYDIEFQLIEEVNMRCFDKETGDLIRRACYEAYDPLWSPDGNFMAYEREREPALIEMATDIYVWKSTYEETWRMTRSGKGNQLLGWSPDSQLIAYVELGEDDMRRVFIADYEAKSSGAQVEPILITVNGTDQSDLAWSGDMQQIAYIACESDEQCDIFVADSDGANARNMTADFDLNMVELDWSPTEAKIAFTAYEGALNDLSGNSDIYLLDVESGDITTVTASDTDPDRYPYGNQESFPLWSPDGTRLAYRTAQYGAVYVTDSQGKNPTNLSFTSPELVGQGGLDWSPDGKYVVFSSPSAIYASTADGRTLVKVLDNLTNTRMSVQWLP